MIGRIAVCLALIAVAVVPAAAQIQGDNWFPIGPAPLDGFFAGGVTGRATAIAPNPENPDDIWLGTATGGTWRSIDGGNSWEPQSDKLASLSIGAIAVDNCGQTRCNDVYVGTGENALRRDTYYGAGLYIGSWSSGEIQNFTWKHLTGTPGVVDFRFASINDVVLDPGTSGNSKRIFITLSSGVTVASPESTVTAPEPLGGFGIYRSNDRGTTWSKLSVAGSNNVRPTDLKMHPDNPQILFAGFLGRGVFRSTDGGNSWCPLNLGVPPVDGCPAQTLQNISLPFDFVTVAISPSNPMVVYATFGRCPDYLLQNCRPAVWRSGDGGDTWEMKGAGSTTDIGIDASVDDGNAHGYSRYTQALTVHPDDEDTLLMGGVRLWRSINGGADFDASDFTEVESGSIERVHSDFRDVVFHETDHTRAYVVSDGGIATSTDGGFNWTARNDGLQVIGFQGIGSSPLTGMIIGTAQDNGGMTWNGSSTWTHRNCCGDGAYSFLDWDEPLRMYANGNHGEISRSADGGNNWTQPGDNPAWFGEPRLFYAPYVQGPSAVNGQHPIYFGTDRLFRSIDNAANFTPISPVLSAGTFPDIATVPDNVTPNPAGGANVISAIAVAPNNPDRIYIGYYGGQIFRSEGAPCANISCWKEIHTQTPAGKPVTRIAVHPDNENIAYATFSGFGNHARVWKTVNGGTLWEPRSGGLPQGVPANTIAIEPSHPQRMYVGLDSAPDGASLYRSTDGGDDWDPWSKGLPNAPVFEISIDETHGRAYAATHGRGAFVLGKPFITNFEGWVNDSIWDIPVWGQNFLPNQNCTMQILQSNGAVCAAGNVDVMGGQMRTDANGFLETSVVDMYSGKKVIWACFNGTCLNDPENPGTPAPIEKCYDDADGDGQPDELSSIILVCGGQIATATVIGCPPLDNPPSTFAGLDLAGLEQTTEAAEVEMPFDAANVSGVLQLTASVQRRVGTQSLCTIAVPFSKGETDLAVLARARDAVNASPTCSANHVQALLDPGTGGPGEDEFPRAPQLRLSAPGVVGGQLVTAIHLDPGSGTGSCILIDDVGVQVFNQLQILKIDLLTPPEGAAGGGTVTLVEQSPQGDCTIVIPTFAGQTRAALAAAMVAAIQAPGIPGPHPGCPARRNPRDITNHGGSLISVLATGLKLCTTDPKIGFDVRSEELANVHPVAEAGDDRVVPPDAPVMFSASLSSDPDSTPGTHDDLLTYEWFDITAGNPVLLGSAETLNVPLAAGLHRIRLRVTDKGGLSDTDEAVVSIDDTAITAGGRILSSFHVGSTHPLGDLSSPADANIHVRADLGYAFSDRFRALFMAGLSQLTSETAAGVSHPRWVNTSLNAQFLFPLSSGTDFFLEAGPGIYWPKGGGSEFGFNLGLGFQLPVRSPYRLEVGADYHRIPGADAEFLTIQFGVLLR